MRALTFLLLAASSVSTVNAQPVGTWSTYPSLSTIRDVVPAGNGRFWAATSGGVYFYDGNRVELVLTPMDGLYQSNPTVLVLQPGTGMLWMGFSDGTLQSYEPGTRRFETMSDIARATQFTRRDIMQLGFKGDTLLAATGFGLVAVNSARKLVTESYTRFASLNGGTPVNGFWIDGNLMYAATGSGVVRSIRPDQLFLPDSWERLPVTGLPAGASMLAVYASGSTVLAGSGGGTFSFNGTNWVPAAGFSGRAVFRFSGSGAQAAATASNGVLLISGATVAPVPVSSARFTAAATDGARFLAGTAEKGVLPWTLGTAQGGTPVLPNGPSLNAFSTISFSNSIFGAGSSTSPGAGSGFFNTGWYLLRGNRWDNYNLETDTTLARTNFNAVHYLKMTPGLALLGSFGAGVAIQDLTTNRVQVFNRGNSPLTGINGGSFIISSGFDTGRDAWIWGTLVLSASTPLFAYQTSTGTWKTFGYPPGISSTNEFSGVLHDSFNQLWIPLGTTGGGGNGILVFRPGDIANDADNRSLHLTESGANLPAARITALVQDKRGEIWAGTTRGVARFLFPELVIDGGVAERQAQWLISEEGPERFFFLRDLGVTSIAVNAANQKWIGSGSGLWLVNESGGRALAHYTRENSPLISNSIVSLAVDEASGTVFIATDLGLMSFVEPARTGLSTAGGLFVYPNPYSYRKNTGPVVIDRLTNESTISILTVDGVLVAKLQAASGRVTWNARDASGRTLTPGVYMVVANDRNGSGRAAGKIIITP